MTKKHLLFGQALLGASLISSALPTQAGWLIVDTGGATTYVQDGRLKNHEAGGGVIMDAKAGQLIMVDAERRQYAAGTVDQFCQAATAMIDMAMQNVPPEYRQMMRQMMGSQAKTAAPPTVKVIKDSTTTMLGQATTKYKIMVNNELAEEIWLADAAALQKEWQPLAGMMQDFEACTKKMGAMTGAVDLGPETNPEYQALMKKGWPLKSVSHAHGQTRTDSEVVRLEQKKIAAAEFQPPAGYKAISFAEFLGGQDMAE